MNEALTIVLGLAMYSGIFAVAYGVAWLIAKTLPPLPGE